MATECAQQYLQASTCADDNKHEMDRGEEGGHRGGSHGVLIQARSANQRERSPEPTWPRDRRNFAHPKLPYLLSRLDSASS